MNPSSLQKLSTVNPSLQAVVKRAAELLQGTDLYFVVTQGIRTRDEQARLYGKGRTAAELSAKKVNPLYAKPTESKVTWTLDSNHLAGTAVDIAPLLNGKVNWDENGKLGLWPRLAIAMKTAASELRTPITWGGDWSGKNLDRPHFELEKK